LVVRGLLVTLTLKIFYWSSKVRLDDLIGGKFL
jgi:hypothetical protein